MGRFLSKIGYYLFFGFCWIITLLPLRVLYGLSGFLYFVFYHILNYRRPVTMANLEKSFPEKSTAELNAISKRFYQRLCDQMVESFKLIHLTQKQILKRFNYQNPELLADLFLSGRSVVLLAGHFTTWEWIVSLGLITKHKVLAVYKQPSFSNLSRIYYYIGRRFNIHPIAMQELYRAIIDSKSRNELSASFILGDQRPQPGNIKYWTSLLNQETPAITGYERIAKKTDQAVVYIDIQFKKRGYYDVTFRKICDNSAGIKDYDLTEEYFRLLENSIIKQPELWLWTHKRWKLKKSPD